MEAKNRKSSSIALFAIVIICLIFISGIISGIIFRMNRLGETDEWTQTGEVEKPSDMIINDDEQGNINLEDLTVSYTGDNFKPRYTFRFPNADELVDRGVELGLLNGLYDAFDQAIRGNDTYRKADDVMIDWSSFIDNDSQTKFDMVCDNVPGVVFHAVYTKETGIIVITASE